MVLLTSGIVKFEFLQLFLDFVDSRHDSRKKFSYKERANKIPLRDRLKQAEAESLIEKSQHEAKLRANRMLAEKRRQEEVEKAQKKLQSTEILKSGDKTSKSGYVTLTQAQLSAILNTLSKVQGSTNEVNLDVSE